MSPIVLFNFSGVTKEELVTFLSGEEGGVNASSSSDEKDERPKSHEEVGVIPIVLP